MPLRAAGVCGCLALVTSTFGWVVGGLAQPGAYSAADDDVSDLGALTASSAWVYNQIGANLTGLLVMALALGVWRALSPDLLGRIGAGALFLVGLGVFFDGLLRLDCRGIDRGCVNDSWHADAHKMESRFTVAAFFLAPLVLAFAFRRIPDWREAWLLRCSRFLRASPPEWSSRFSETALRSGRRRLSGFSGPRISACS